MYAYGTTQLCLTHPVLDSALGETAYERVSVFSTCMNTGGQSSTRQGDICKLSPQTHPVLTADTIARVVTNCLYISINIEILRILLCLA